MAKLREQIETQGMSDKEIALNFRDERSLEKLKDGARKNKIFRVV